MRLIRTASFSLVIFVILGIGLVSGAFIGARVMRPYPPDLSNLNKWVLIKSFYGKLNPQEAAITAQVYVYQKFSDGRDPYTVLQNRIEVTTDDGSQHVFLWPSSQEYAGGWSEIVDLALDQRKEFLLFMHARTLRVVRYAAGRFEFRPNLDTLGSWNSDIRLLDLDNDGVVELVAGDAVYDPSLGRYFEVPRIKRWVPDRGFVDVSSKYPAYYKDVVLPDLKSKQGKAVDPASRTDYERAIEFISSNFLAANKPQTSN